MGQFLQFLLGAGALMCLLSALGCGFYLPVLVTRYAFLRMAGKSPGEAVDYISNWGGTQSPTPTPPPPPQPVHTPTPAVIPTRIQGKAGTACKGSCHPLPRHLHGDENITPSIVSGLKAKCFDVTHSRTVGLGGATDEENLSFSYGERRVVLSFDADFLILHHKQLPHAGIIHLAQGATAEDVIQLYNQVWS